MLHHSELSGPTFKSNHDKLEWQHLADLAVTSARVESGRVKKQHIFYSLSSGETGMMKEE